jgi:MerR family transcriptional regulator, repressor of the yfmOP operon
VIAERTYRIGEVAELAGTTPRTIRYYEEIGLLPTPPGFEKGRHRTFGEAEVARLKELIRLRDLLGISLEELKGLVEAEEARAVIRERFQTTDDPAEQKQLLDQAHGHVEAQLALVRSRREALDQLEGELTTRRKRIRSRLREIEGS